MNDTEMNVPAIVYPDTVITRRDFFAAHALNGLLQGLYGDQPKRLDYIINEAVRLADDLMGKLDELE